MVTLIAFMLGLFVGLKLGELRRIARALKNEPPAGRVTGAPAARQWERDRVQR